MVGKGIGGRGLIKRRFFHYNLACYDCQLGDIDSAKGRLRRGFEIDSNFRRIALEDVDLEPLWEMLSAELKG